MNGRSRITDKPNSLGGALALLATVVIGYGAFSLMLLVFPALKAGLMAALFHALDVFHMQRGPDLLHFPYLLCAVLATITFFLGLGTLYFWIRDKLLSSTRGKARHVR